MVVEAESYEDNEASKIYNLLIENGYDGFEIVLTLYKRTGPIFEAFLQNSLLRFPHLLKGLRMSEIALLAFYHFRWSRKSATAFLLTDRDPIDYKPRTSIEKETRKLARQLKALGKE